MLWRTMNAEIQTELTDPLSEALRAWPLPGWWAGIAQFDAPWGMAVSEGLGSLYVVLAGRCCLTLADGSQQEEVEAGDVLLLSQGVAYCFQDSPESPTVPYPGNFALRGVGPPTRQDSPGSTRLVFGHFSIATPGANQPGFGFDPIVRLQAESCRALSGYRAIAAAMAEEQSVQAPGWQAVVDHLAQTLLMQTLRALVLQARTALGDQSDAGIPLLRATLDGAVGPALELIHRRPEERWTVTSLASHVRISKSSFSERFHALVGIPPLRYLTEYRMRKACRLLLDTELGVKEIASMVGYDSASSFSNAFKRRTGKSPAEYRKNGYARPKGTLFVKTA